MPDDSLRLIRSDPTHLGCTVLAPVVARHLQPPATGPPFSGHAAAEGFFERHRWQAMLRAGAWKLDRHGSHCHRQWPYQDLSRSPGLGSAHAAVRAGELDAPDPR